MSELEEFFNAVGLGDVSRVDRLLTAQPGLINARDPEGATPLHVAAVDGNRALVELLCARGGDVNARDAQHNATPSGWAIHYLREMGGLLAIEIEDVLFAIGRREAHWVRRLVERHPALIEAKDRNGRPLATHARESGDPAIAAVFESPAPGA